MYASEYLPQWAAWRCDYNRLELTEFHHGSPSFVAVSYPTTTTTIIRIINKMQIKINQQHDNNNRINGGKFLMLNIRSSVNAIS